MVRVGLAQHLIDQFAAFCGRKDALDLLGRDLSVPVLQWLLFVGAYFIEEVEGDFELLATEVVGFFHVGHEELYGS